MSDGWSPQNKTHISDQLNQYLLTYIHVNRIPTPPLSQSKRPRIGRWEIFPNGDPWIPLGVEDDCRLEDGILVFQGPETFQYLWRWERSGPPPSPVPPPHCQKDGCGLSSRPSSGPPPPSWLVWRRRISLPQSPTPSWKSAVWSLPSPDILPPESWRAWGLRHTDFFVGLTITIWKWSVIVSR